MSAPPIVTSVFAPAVASGDYATPYDLIDLTLAREELKLPVSDTSNDKWLVRAATQVSTAINNYCNRVFQVEGVSDLIYAGRAALGFRAPSGPAPLQLSRWPLVNIVVLPTAADTPSGATLPFASTAKVAAGQPASGANIAPGTTVLSVITDTSVTLSQPIVGDIPAGTSVTLGLSLARTNADLSLTGLVYGSDYTAQIGVGQLYRLDPRGRLADWEARPTTVNYYAGYETIPADVVDAALRLLTNRFYSRGRDPNLREQDMPGVGRQTWWVGGPPKSGGMPLEIADLLDRYRVPVIG